MAHRSRGRYRSVSRVRAMDRCRRGGRRRERSRGQRGVADAALARAAAPDRDGKDERAAPADRHGPLSRRGLCRACDGNAELHGLLDQVVGDARPGKAMMPFGRRFSSSSFLLNGAARPCRSQSGLQTIWCAPFWSGSLRRDLVDAGGYLEEKLCHESVRSGSSAHVQFRCHSCHGRSNPTPLRVARSSTASTHRARCS